MTSNYQHLVKPLLPGQSPKGLYAQPCVWMEGKDLEGFNGHFSYGFVKEPGSCHPVGGSLVHPYDECLVFASIDTADFYGLDAEVSIKLGEGLEEYAIKEASVVVVPKGTPHGPITVKRVGKPFAHLVLGLASSHRAEPFLESSRQSKGAASNYGHLVKKLTTAPDRFKGRGNNPLLGPGNFDEIAWLFGDDLEGLNVNFSWGHYSHVGPWYTGVMTSPHTHPKEEALIHVGFDPERPDYFGAETEHGVGGAGETILINKPSVVIAPGGFVHGPGVTHSVEKPFGFLVFCLDGKHDSRYKKDDEGHATAEKR